MFELCVFRPLTHTAVAKEDRNQIIQKVLFSNPRLSRLSAKALSSSATLLLQLAHVQAMHHVHSLRLSGAKNLCQNPATSAHLTRSTRILRNPKDGDANPCADESMPTRTASRDRRNEGPNPQTGVDESRCKKRGLTPQSVMESRTEGELCCKKASCQEALTLM